MPEIADELKKALKDHGFNQRQVSVKHQYCGYSESLHVTIRDPNVSKLEIEDIVRPFKAVDHDERTGEVLEGGNTYVVVERDYRHPVEATALLESAEKSIAALPEESATMLPVEGTAHRYLVNRENGVYFSLWGQKCDTENGRNVIRSGVSCLGRYFCGAPGLSVAIRENELDLAYVGKSVVKGKSICEQDLTKELLHVWDFCGDENAFWKEKRAEYGAALTDERVFNITNAAQEEWDKSRDEAKGMGMGMDEKL